MNLPYYIARRISKSSTAGISGKIIKIAIASISFSMAIMILSTAVLLGFKEEVSEKVFGFWGHIHITDTRMSRTFELSPILNDDALKDSIRSIAQLSYSAVDNKTGRLSERQTNGGVKEIVPYIVMPGIINSKSEAMEAVLLKGLNKEYDWKNFEAYLKEGTFPSFMGEKATRDILISEQTSKRMQVKVGEKVIIYFLKDQDPIKRAFTVSAIYKTGLEEYDKKIGFVDIRVLQDVLDWRPDEVAGFEVFIDDIDDVAPIADYIYSEILPPQLYDETIKEKFASMFDWIKMQDINGILLLVLMAIVALVNMCTALLILILERSQMIGVLKSLGLSNWGLRKIFIYIALWIMGISLIIGNLLGLGIGFIQKMTGLIKLDEANYYLSEVPVKFDMLSILGVNIAAIVMTMIVMIIPTYLVTKIKPVEILRFQ
ncbi:FtsX-like permease family protein [Saprospiraceae bacterium]|nr:FtsX-like permease family protein [Saprospiraceae bacterium]